MSNSLRLNDNFTEMLLSLSEAADQLGVHPATLRRWAKAGDVVYVLTPGGHRRFPVSEIRRLTRGHASRDDVALRASLESQAMMQTRSALVRQRDMDWIAGMEETDKEKQREVGRQVMGLLMQFVVTEDDGADLLLEAIRMGEVYAEMTSSAGLTLSQTIQALMFFRDNIIESIVDMPESVRARPDANRRLLRRANMFLNEILLGVTEASER